MVRKSKDLFVILAERQQRSQSRRDNGASSGRKAAQKDGSRESASKAREVGSTLGRWMQGAVRTMRGDEAATSRSGSKAKAHAKSSTSTSTKTSTNSKAKVRSSDIGGRGRRAPREVPKGLLIPGWLLAGMVVVGIGSGFVVGRMTSGLSADWSLDGRSGPRIPGKFIPREGVVLSAVEEERELHKFFYVCGVVGPNQRDEAARIAFSLREEGVAAARIRPIFAEGSDGGSISNWAIVCYVASNPAPPAVLETLQRLAKPLDLDLETYKGLMESQRS